MGLGVFCVAAHGASAAGNGAKRCGTVGFSKDKRYLQSPKIGFHKTKPAGGASRASSSLLNNGKFFGARVSSLDRK